MSWSDVHPEELYFMLLFTAIVTFCFRGKDRIVQDSFRCFHAKFDIPSIARPDLLIVLRILGLFFLRIGMKELGQNLMRFGHLEVVDMKAKKGD